MNHVIESANNLGDLLVLVDWVHVQDSLAIVVELFRYFVEQVRYFYVRLSSFSSLPFIKGSHLFLSDL